MKFLRLASLVYSALICSCSVSLAQATNELVPAISNSIVALQDAPPIDGTSFCCDSMVHAVNSLRHLGKENALKALRQYVGEQGKYPFSNESETVLLVCRLLFNNPSGWEEPRLGQSSPEVNRQLSNEDHVFPLFLSRGVPFLLIYGYNGSGYTDDDANKCLQLCESFTLISKDLPESGYDSAASALVNSEEFRALYLDTNEMAFAEKMILAQTQCPNPMARRKKDFRSSIEVKVWSVPQTNK